MNRSVPPTEAIAAAPAFVPSVDRVTFEIVRHRLWQINDEQGTTIKNVSGSPIASEIQDFNVGIADASGQLVCCGMYLLVHVTGLHDIISNCISIVGLDRIRPGDMFLTNDAWMGAVHHNDVAIIAPLFHDGKLIGWTGSVIHQADVGGPAPGSWNIDATDTFQEAPRYRFLRIVSEGDVCPEVIESIITNSRTPHLIEIDFRAQIAAANVVRERMAALIQRYGIETVSQVMQDCLSDTEIKLRRKLAALPDGIWYAESHVDHDGHEDNLHTIRLCLQKKYDKLIFDFTGSDAQANGLINITRSCLMSAPFASLLTYVCGGMQWNEGIMRTVEVVSSHGTIVDCAYPAPVASGIVNTGWAALNACCSALGRLLVGTEHESDAMAVWAGAPFGINLFGTRPDGSRFGALLGTSPLQGGGARTFADGYDVSGYLHAPRCGAMNVESTEHAMPVLHLFRRRALDTGGPGMFRGGQGVATAITPHGTDGFHMITTSFGSDQSGSAGLAGGMPGGGSNGAIHRGEHPFAPGNCSAAAPHEMRTTGQAMPAKARDHLALGDVFVVVTHGGGGFGDPLRRDLNAIAQDIAQLSVSPDVAVEVYGVVFDANGQIEKSATKARRSKLLEARRASATPLGVNATADRQWSLPAQCPCCATVIAEGNVLRHVQPLGAAGPWLAVRWGGESRRFDLTTALCGACGTALDCVQSRRTAAASL